LLGLCVMRDSKWLVYIRVSVESPTGMDAGVMELEFRVRVVSGDLTEVSKVVDIKDEIKGICTYLGIAR
jgi:hypothetical protein